MTNAVLFTGGNYRFVPSGVLQYSGGVAAEKGFTIKRMVFSSAVRLKDGFNLINAILREEGRPLTALCACELRSPAPLSESGFSSFNNFYFDTLKTWGLFDGTHNPVARSNVCPAVSIVNEPSFYAFSYTVASEVDEDTFVIAGSSEVPEGNANYKDYLVCYQNTSPAGILSKARWVLGEMERRLSVLGYEWHHCTASQLYTVHNPHPFLAEEFARRGAMSFGLNWHYVRPPVIDMEFEMDCRRVLSERVQSIG